MNEAALAIKVTTDAQEAVSGLSDTAGGLDSVSDAASSAGKVSGQTARALGGLGKGLKLIGQDEAAETLQQAGMALQFVKGTSGLAKLATEGYAKATKATAAAQAALNAVMAANPVLLIVIAVVALAAAFVIAYKKSETFRNIVNAAGRAIAKTFGATISFIQNNWKKMLVILTGPIGLAVLLIIKHKDRIIAAIGGAKDWITEKWKAVKDLLAGPVQRAKELIGTAIEGVKTALTNAKTKTDEIGLKIKGFLEAAFSPISSAVTAIGDLIKKIGDLIAKIKSIPKPDFGLGNPFNRVSSRGLAVAGAARGTTPVWHGDINVYVTVERGFVGSERQLAVELKRILGNDLRRLAGAA